MISSHFLREAFPVTLYLQLALFLSNAHPRDIYMVHARLLPRMEALSMLVFPAPVSLMPGTELVPQRHCNDRPLTEGS